MYISASGVAANIARQNVVSNNLANASTVGFKPDMLAIRHRADVRTEDGLGGFYDSNAMIERLGAGVQPTATRISQEQGNLQYTDNDLDIAVQGEGFLRVLAMGPDGSPTEQLTRDGRLTMASDGKLVRSTDGAAVLDGDGEEIRVNPQARKVTVDDRGFVMQDGVAVARLELVAVPDPSGLIKGGNGNLRLPEGVTRADYRPATGRIVAGALEDAAVDPVEAMMAVTGASRGAQTNMRMMTTFYEVMGSAINRFGRVG